MLKFKLTILLACLLFALPALAEETICSNDWGECEIDQVGFNCSCVDGSGVGGSMDFDVDGDVDGDFEANDLSDEYCKQTLAKMCPAFEECKTEKGECRTYEDGAIDCRCADGTGANIDHPGDFHPADGDSIDEVDGDQVVDHDEEKDVVVKDDLQSCGDLLTQTCPNDPPDPEEECATEAYQTCNDMINWQVDCAEDSIAWPYRIIRCCEYFDEVTKTTWDCLMGKSCTDGYKECYGGEGGMADGDATDDGSGKDLNGESEATDGSGDGCSHTGSPAGFVMMIMALFITFRKRIFNL